MVDVNGASPLTLACEAGNPEIVASLLKSGANAKASRADGISALALCAGTSSSEALTALIAKGANVNATDLQGQTPLMWASSYNRVRAMKVLLSRGANIEATSKIEDIGAREDAMQQRRVLRPLDVGGERFLAAVEPREVARHALGRAVVAAREVALRALDLDHARARVGEPARAIGRGDRLLEGEHGDARERAAWMSVFHGPSD
jgi:hypothetical protein